MGGLGVKRRYAAQMQRTVPGAGLTLQLDGGDDAALHVAAAVILKKEASS